MKRPLCFLFTTLIGMMPAFAQGIAFESVGFDAALAKAKTENKYLFVDCYTSWCGPCKQIAKNIFPLEEVGAFFNARFINIQIDMEKGEGPALSKRFAVTAFPTFLIVRPDGTLQHKFTGADDLAASFLKRTQQGLDDATANGTMYNEFASGRRDQAFLAAFLQQCLAQHDAGQARRLVHILFDSLRIEKQDTALWYIYSDESINQAALPSLIEHRAFFNEAKGKAAVDLVIAYRQLRNVLGAKKAADLEVAVDSIARLDLTPEMTEILLSAAELYRIAVFEHDKDKAFALYDALAPSLKPYPKFFPLLESRLVGALGAKIIMRRLKKTKNATTDEAD